jgi:hypothetical protein
VRLSQGALYNVFTYSRISFKSKLDHGHTIKRVNFNNQKRYFLKGSVFKGLAYPLSHFILANSCLLSDVYNRRYIALTTKEGGFLLFLVHLSTFIIMLSVSHSNGMWPLLVH